MQRPEPGRARRAGAGRTSRPWCSRGFHGLRVMPCSGQSPGDFQPNSVVVVLPTITAPAAFSPTTHRRVVGDRRRVGGAAAAPGREAGEVDQVLHRARARRPAGPSGRPARQRAALSPAASSARGFITAKAFSAGVEPGDALGDGLQHLDRAERAAGDTAPACPRRSAARGRCRAWVLFPIVAESGAAWRAAAVERNPERRPR